MKLKTLAPNQSVLELPNGTEIFFSYETPVAGHVPGRGFIRTDIKWSVTTQRHISAYLNGQKALTVAQAEINKLVK